MKSPQAISVVMPVGADGPWVDQAVGSVMLASAGFPVEIVLVGDGLELSNRWGRRVAVHSIPQSGICAALNYGLESASGEWVVRMDGDDICHPHRFTDTVAALRNSPSAALLAGDIVKFGQGAGPRHEPAPQDRTELLELLLHAGYGIAHPATAYRRSAVIDAGGYTLGTEGYEDLDLWLRLLIEREAEYAPIGSTVLYYRVHPAQASATSRRLKQVGERLTQQALSSRPCGPGCPGRLASFQSERAGDLSGTCRTRRSALGMRALRSQMRSSPQNALVALPAAMLGRARSSVVGELEWRKERAWFDLL